jgi:putative Holliday junction resolvase
MTVLGIDYGRQKIGLAVSDSQASFALPLDILHGLSKKEAVEKIKNYCQEREVEEIVIGVPFFNENYNQVSDLGQEIESFIKLIDQEIGIKVATVDERYSTKLAGTLHQQTGKKNSGNDDDVSAMVILQSYLDKKKFNSLS